jgi:transposase
MLSRESVSWCARIRTMPWDSGDTRTDQPISKVGNRRARTMAIGCAWMWTLHQPDSALTRWWRQRFARGGKRRRRIGIVALARKLMIALWRYVKQGSGTRGCGARVDTNLVERTPTSPDVVPCTGWGVPLRS